MILNGNNHVRGIFKYSDDIEFEKDDFVVDGNCIYICKASESIKGVKPSLDTAHLYYSEYPGDKVASASEYYSYLMASERDEQVEDKYISAQTLCEILENMYFGFGDNGTVYDHILYNPNTGIEYSIRGTREILDYSTPNVLDRVLRNNSLSNGLIRVSRTLPEIRDLLMDNSASESDVVILKQYTYRDSNNFIPYRVQELMDPEKNQLYFRFSKGEALDEGGIDFTDAIVSQWKSLYSSNEDAIEKLNAIQDYYIQRIHEEEDKIARISGKYCYREVEPTEYNRLGENIVYLRPGETRDIKSIPNFNSKPCLLNILIKTQASSGVFRNYSLVIDAKDACDSVDSSESYIVGDGITLVATFNGSESIQTLTLNVSGGGVIKNIYYRDNTLGHVHDWVLQTILEQSTCTEPGLGAYICTEPNCPIGQITEPIPPLGHNLTHHVAKDPTCIESGWWEYWLCSRCGIYFEDSLAQEAYSGWDTGDNQVYRAALGSEGHRWSNWVTTRQATCTTTGRKVRSCTRCGQQEVEVIPALGHDTVFVAAHEETCGDYGFNEHWHCTRCNRDFQEEEAINQLSSKELLRYPTGHHNLNAYNSHAQHAVRPIILQESTYTDWPEIGRPKPEHGKGLEICADCGNEIEVSIPFRKHIFSEEAEPGQAFVVNGEHYPSYTIGYCPECLEIRRNYNFREDIPIDRQLSNHTVYVPSEFSEADQIRPDYTPATCDEYGYWKGTCILCGMPDVKQYNWDDPPTGHVINGDNREKWIPNTCTTDAEWYGKCSVCDHDNVSAIDESHLKIGHIDDNHDDICDVCRADLSPLYRTNTTD